MTTPVLVILGYGARTASHIASKFASNGFKVAVTGRSLQDGYTPEKFFAIKADLADPEIVTSIFERVKAELGTPSVVVYNGMA
jgi:NAD(P)-dependent dehydrogenase (short-subunit alcohol dehydrogenase family)